MAEVSILSEAIVCENSDFSIKNKLFNGGVLTKEGNICFSSIHFKPGYENIPSTFLEPIKKIQGNWIFGGMLQNGHFGHFITESISRLWACKYIDNIEGVIFYNRYCGKENKKFIFDFFKIIIPKLKVIIIDSPVTVDRLFIPEQLHCGNGFINGSSFNKSLFVDVPELKPKGINNLDKIYITRKELTSTEGNIIGNNEIANVLSGEGYTCIAPEKLTLEEQIYIYRHAKRLVFDQGSAFHMYNLFGNDRQNVYIIWRRKKVINGYIAQYNSFFNSGINRMSCICRQFAPIAHTNNTAKFFGLPDFEKLFNELFEQGFIRKQKLSHSSFNTDELLSQLSNKIGKVVEVE